MGDGGDEMFVGYEKYLIDDVENKLRSKFFEVVWKFVFLYLVKLVGKVFGMVGKKVKLLFISLFYEFVMGFYIINSMMIDEMW